MAIKYFDNLENSLKTVDTYITECKIQEVGSGYFELITEMNSLENFISKITEANVLIYVVWWWYKKNRSKPHLKRHEKLYHAFGGPLSNLDSNIIYFEAIADSWDIDCDLLNFVNTEFASENEMNSKIKYYNDITYKYIMEFTSSNKGVPYIPALSLLVDMNDAINAGNNDDIIIQLGDNE